MSQQDSTLLKAALSIDRVVTCLALLAAIGSLLVMFGSLLLEVIMRYLTNASLGWTTETPNLLFPWLVMGGAVLAAQHGQHIVVKAVLPFLSKNAARGLFICLELLALTFFIYLAYIGLDVIAIVATEVYPVTGVSSKWAYLALIAGFGGIVLTSLTNLMRLSLTPDPFVIRVPLAEAEI